MKRILTVFAIGVLLGLPMALFPTTSAQEIVVTAFPAAAVIRGENIRLRLDPTAAADDVAIMQRGDAITITGEPVSADGMTFYPIELTATGETGWVRDLFIDPRSIALAPAPAAPAPAENQNGNGRQRRNRNQNNQNQAEVTPAPEPANDQARADRQARREQRNQQQEQEQAQAGAVTPEAAAATPTPESANVVPPVTAAASVAGVGAGTSDPIALEPGRYRATASMQVNDSSGFIATLKGPNDFSEELFNETIDTPQAWTAGTVVRIRDAGDYTVEVSDTKEAWTIAFEQLPPRE